jgi:hypothetical protein
MDTTSTRKQIRQKNRRLPTCSECSTTSLARNQDQLLKLTQYQLSICFLDHARAGFFHFLWFMNFFHGMKQNFSNLRRFE